jgi:ribosome-associated protein
VGEGPLLMASSPKTKTSPPAEAPALQMIDVVLKSLDDAKAEDTVAIDITGKSSLSDHMVVTSGRSHRHVGAVADQVEKALREAGFGKPRIEGLPHCDWVLVDAGDVIVHIFRPEVREFYNLEKMWQAEFSADTR